MFTQQHFNAMADKLHRLREDIVRERPQKSAEEYAAAIEALNLVVLAMCDLFAKHNPRFDKLRFIGATHRGLLSEE